MLAPMRGRVAIGAVIALGAGAVAIFGWVSGDNPRPDERTRAGQGLAELAAASEPNDAEGSVGDEGEPAAAGEEVSRSEEDAVAAGDEEYPKRKIHIAGVVLEGGAPAAGATVHAQAEDEAVTSTRSGADGRFAVDLSARYFVKIDALKGENLRGSALVETRAKKHELVRIELQPASVVIVSVTSRRLNEPVEGARVACVLRFDAASFDRLAYDQRTAGRASAEAGFGPVDTDGDGKARLLILKGGQYEIEAEHDRLGVVVREHALSMSTTPQQIALELAGGSAVFGHLVNEARQPIADTEVYLAPEKQTQRGYRRAKTDTGGDFRFEGVEAGRFVVHAEPAKYLSVEHRIEKKDDLNDLEVEVVAQAGATIEGRAFDPHQAPAAGWRVQALADSAAAGFTRLTAITQKDGSFVIERCPPGDYLLTLARSSAPGALWAGVWAGAEKGARAKSGDKDVVLHATEGGTLHGEVRFEGADPPASYTISVMGQKTEQEGSSSSFVLNDLIPGRGEVTVTAPGFGAARAPFNLKESATANVSLTLRPSRRVSGRVLDRSGPPIESALVRATTVVNGSPFIDEQIAAARTAKDGTFTLEGVAPGRMNLIARADGYITAPAGPFEIGPEGPPIVVKLVRAVRFAGRVHAGPRSPRSGFASVTPDSAKDGASLGDLMRRESRLRQDGTFIVDGVGPGRVEISVGAAFENDGEWLSRSRLFDVPPAGLDDVDIDFDGGGASLVVSLPLGIEKRISLSLAEGRLDDRNTRRTGLTAWQHQTARPGTTEAVFRGLKAGAYTLFAEGGHGLFDYYPSAPPEPPPIHVRIEAGQLEVRVTLPAP